MIDRDELQRGAAAGREVAGDGIEIGAPPALADRLDHLDRGDRVEPLIGVAIILEPDFDPVGEAGGGDLVLRPGLLLPRQGQADHLGAAPGRLDRERAPAAADLEQSLAGLELEPVEQRCDLAALRSLETVVGRAKRARK